MLKLFQKEKNNALATRQEPADEHASVKLLITDSDARFQKKLIGMLHGTQLPDEYSAGIQFESAFSLREAIDKIESGSFDLILTDINLEDATGLLVLEEMIEHGEGTPIIILSNLTNWSTVMKTAQSGVSDFLFKKTLEPDLLLRSIFYGIERSKLELKANRAEATYRSLVSILPEGLFRINDEGKFTYVNELFARMMHRSETELLEMTPKEFFKQQGLNQLQEACNRVLSEGCRVELEFALTSIQDLEQTYLFVGTPVLNQENGCDGMQGIILDVTQQQQIHDEKNTAKALEMLRSGLSIVSTELNNAMAPMLLDAQFMEERLSDPRDLQCMERIQESVHKARSILRPFLVTTQAVGPRFETLDASKIILQIAQATSAELPADIRLEWQIGNSLNPINGDASLISKLLDNLIRNGVESISDKGIVSIAARSSHFKADDSIPQVLQLQPGDYLHITIKDQGHGIAPHLTHRIFEPFYTTKEKPHQGMGLTEALGIVKSHNGNLKISSEFKGGTCVEIFIPFSSPHSSIKSQKNKSVANTEKMDELSEHLVLVVDDEVNILETTTNLLEARGFRVITASNGAEGLAKFNEYAEEIKLIITDFAMPAMDGPTMIRTIRQIAPSIKIILMTGFETDDKVSEIAALEVNDTLFKPFSATKLFDATLTQLGEFR